ncbi:MAG: thymidylate synthase [Bacteroidales bacterium]
MEIKNMICIQERNLAKAWSESIKALLKNGRLIKTQYDDLESYDSPICITVTDPMSEPRIHKSIPAGITELYTYVEEVLSGIHNHWISPEEGKWTYTYNERIFNYKISTGEFDQFNYMVDSLVKCPYTRRAQAIIWDPEKDTGDWDCPCLQRIWARIVDNKLDMHVHMRSNDAWQAAFMNMFAFTLLQKKLVDTYNQRTVESIKVGNYIHFVDSYHIYNGCFDQVEAYLEREDQTVDFNKLCMDTRDYQEHIDEAYEAIARSIEQEKLTGRKGL